MAAKKSSKAKKKKSPKKPSAAFIKKVMAALESGELTVKPAAKAAAEGIQCEDGKTPQKVEFQHADGTTETKIVCV